LQARFAEITMDGAPLTLEPGRNCCRVADAERLALSIEGESYFRAVRRSMLQARRRIAIVGWDLHSRVELSRGDEEDGLPTALGDLLVALLKRRAELQAYVLLWDWSPIYALEREPLFFGNDPWESHERLHFITDDAHPLAASQHQKLVCIDGRIAWCGGFDLSRWRWDTTRHPAEHPQRCEPEGDPYPPFHDQQVLVDGAAAAGLEETFLDRWHRAGGGHLEPLAGQVEPEDDGDPWPQEIEPWLRHRKVGIARTFPPYGSRPSVREVEQLYLDMIDGARRLIYIENQYLTSRSVRDALCRVLRRDDPPRVVIILPKDTGKWLEQYTMDALRVRALAQLREADSRQRLGVYYPEVPGLAQGCMMVHSKLMMVDDRVLRIGSSNLSNRSMGLDSECDLVMVADDEATREQFRDLRRHLIAMYMWMEPGDVARAESEAEERGAGLVEAIEILRAEKADHAPEGDNRLAPLTGESDPQWEKGMPDERLVDPDRPLSPELLARVIAEPEHHPHIRRRVAIGLGIIVAFAALATLWHFTPLGELIHPRDAIAASRELADSFPGPLVAIGGFLVAAISAVPVTLVVLASTLVFGPAAGAIIALVGTAVAAIAGYELGRWLGRNEIGHLVGRRLDRVKRRLSRRGALAIVALRIVPIAPFAILNLIAGATHWHRREFIIGSLIGMVPHVMLMAFIAYWLLGYMERDDLRAIAFLVGIGIIVGGTADVLRRIVLRLTNGRARRVGQRS
jgi:phosphatidylserine/phosphatidylglycerophosphate/cardiolipin synthase-like enzyme/uncharacterized membrane protein YdjX (TVP38/TMEM64 family)